MNTPLPASTEHIRPAWALAGLLIGWAVSVLLIPEKDYQEPGALMLPGIIFCIGTVWGVLVAGARSPVAMFRTEHFLMLGIVYWIMLDAAQGAYAFWTVSQQSIVTAFHGVAVFAASLWIGSGLTSVYRPPRAAPSPEVGSRFLFTAVVISFLLGMLRVFVTCKLSPVCIIDAFYAPRYETAWWRTEVGNWDTLLIHLRNIGYLTLPLTVALVRRERRISWGVVVAAVLSLMFLVVLIRDGGRREVGVVLGGSALVWILQRERLRFRDLAMAAALAVALLYLMQAMLAWRDQGFGTGLREGAGIKYQTRRGLSVDTNLAFMAFIADYVPARHPHTGWTGIEYVFTYPVPRSVLPSKPYSRGFNLPAYRGMKVHRNYSWTCSAVGDLYLIGSFPAIIAGGLVFGLLANLCSRFMLRGNAQGYLLFAMGTMSLFVGLRALHELIVIGFSFLGLVGLLALYRAVTKRRESPLPVPARQPVVTHRLSIPHTPPS